MFCPVRQIQRALSSLLADNQDNQNSGDHYEQPNQVIPITCVTSCYNSYRNWRGKDPMFTHADQGRTGRETRASLAFRRLLP
jgi:hypothetical protein